ncbi:MAG: alpha/beta hydrolase [Christensenellales bacterium]|jgi:fermentation-respiration switch protein FrsA (DUF1100 family)
MGWIALIVPVVLAALALAVGNYYYNLSLNPHRDKSEVFSAEHNRVKAQEAALGEDAFEAWFENAPRREMIIRSYDHLNLCAYVMEHEDTSGNWCVLCHGYTAGASSMAWAAMEFHKRGYNLLLPYFRGHGKSQGRYIGMGWHDRLDIVEWIGEINARYRPKNVALFGVSMGGAAVMMASGEKLPDNVRVIVEDCGYSSVRQEFIYQAKMFLKKIPAAPVVACGSLVTQLRAGYWLGEASSVRQLKKSVTPTLFIHGSRDTFVPPHMLDEVYEACAAPKKKLLVEGAGHAGSAAALGDAYWRQVFDFISAYMQ